MNYEVVIEANNSAAIERLDVDNKLCELYFVITFTGDGEIEHGRGTYRFRSMSFLCESFGDPRGYRTIGMTFHGKTDVKRAVEATSLEDACAKFFAEWPGDHFKLVGRLTEASQL